MCHFKDINSSMFIHSKATYSMKRYGTVFLSLFMILYSVVVYSQDTEDDSRIANDLYVALTLQGINCDGVSKLERSSEEGYDVVCSSGGHYSIGQTKDGVLSVVDLLTGKVRKGIGKFLGFVPLTGQIYQLKGELTEHNTEIARSLFSIIELSGNKCAVITNVVSDTTDEHTVSCENGQTYHVYTTEDGLVAVDIVSTNEG